MGDSRPMLARALTLLSIGAAAGPVSGANCPSTDAVSAEVARLGTTDAMAAVGSAEVTVQGTRMRLTLRGLDGAVLGVREVSAPLSCVERASVAATLISAWVGAWPTGALSKPVEPQPPLQAERSLARRAAAPAAGASLLGPAPAAPPTVHSESSVARTPAPATPKPLVTSPAIPAAAAGADATATPAGSSSVDTANPPFGAPSSSLPDAPSPPSPVHAHDAATADARAAGWPASRIPTEVGAFGVWMHDGDAGALGGGIRAGYRSLRWFGLDILFAASGPRERALEPGLAAYRLYALGLGATYRRNAGRAFGELGLFPEATLLAVEGRQLDQGRGVTRWGAAAEAHLRLGLALGPWRPFVLVGGSYAFRAERLTLDDHRDRSITLSRWNSSLGLGLAYLFGAQR